MTAQTQVVNRYKSKYDIYIGRGSSWGNPFVLGRDGDRASVIAQYELYLREREDLVEALPTLRGKILGCFCKPQACHGDVLAAYADQGVPPEPLFQEQARGLF